MASNDGEESFAALLAAETATGEQQSRPRAGDRVVARVVTMGPVMTLLDIGATGEASIATRELCDTPAEQPGVAPGDSIEVIVVDDGQQSGSIVCRRVGRGGLAAEDLADAFAFGLPVEGLVTGLRKGGFEVQVGQLRAFCPSSQIDVQPGEPQQYLGQRLRFKVTRLEASGRNVVLGRRALLEAEAMQQRAETLARLEVGAIVRGRVTTLRDFGAFVDLGGVEGLLHVSELGWEHGVMPDQVLEPGQEVTVQVVKRENDPKTGEARIGLSMRALLPDPWTEVAARFPPGATLRGRVRRLESFGAFVTVAPGVDGLVHISQLAAGRRLSHPRQVVQEGQEIEVTVLDVDPAKRRIALSMIEGARHGAEAAEQADRKDAAARMAEARIPGQFGTLGDLLAASRRKRS